MPTVRSNRPEKIVFYSSIARSFTSSLIGQLYDICQVFPTVLVSENLDLKTEKILKNEKLFPCLKKIISVGKEKPSASLSQQHRKSFLLAREIIEKYQPTAVMASGNLHFGSYLRRFGKENGAVTVSGMGPLLIRNIKDFFAFRILLSAHLMPGRFLPFYLKKQLVKIKKHFGHFFYYWFLPLSSAQKPFVGEPSTVLWWDYSRDKGADYFYVFTKQNRDFLIRQGFDAKKLCLLPHPLLGKSREFFKKEYLPLFVKKRKGKQKIMTIIWPDLSVGFRRSNSSIIPEKEINNTRMKAAEIFSKTLTDWKILIKPHPTILDVKGQLEKLTKFFKSISSDFEVIPPSEPAETYFEESSAIAGLPPDSIALFNASLQKPEIPVLSVDLAKEIVGDSFKGSDAIEYIDNEKELESVLKDIKSGRYKKKVKKEEKAYDFSSLSDFLESLLNKKQ